MKRLAIALMLLTVLAFGIQQSYSWFSGRDEAPSSVVKAGNLNVALTSSIGNTAYLSPSLIESGEEFSIGYTLTNNNNVPAIARVNQAGVRLKGQTISIMNKGANSSDMYTFRLYKLTDKCFKLLNHIRTDSPEKYVDFEYLDSIGFVPFDISSPNYEAVPLIFNKHDGKGFYTEPDIGLRLSVSVHSSDIIAFAKLATGSSSRGFCINELAPDPLRPHNCLYFYLPKPKNSTNDQTSPLVVDVKYTFSLPGNNPSVLSGFDNTFQYSVITLDVTQESLTDELGNNYLGDLKAVAIESNAGAFRSVFNNYADEPIFYYLPPVEESAGITHLPLPDFAPFKMDVTHIEAGSTTVHYTDLGAAPDEYEVIECTNDKETIFDIPALESFDVEISSPYCAVDQVPTRISLKPNEDAKAGTVAVIQILLKKSNTVMLTIKVVK